MKILFVASEMAPWAKTGGLADVVGALPQALARLGHEVAVAIPFYGVINREKLSARRVLPEVIVDLPLGRRWLALWQAELPANGAAHPVSLWLVEDQGLFNRPQLYAMEGREYPDNALRFGYFCMATLWAIKGLGWTPDVISCHDWQAALVPIYLTQLPALAADPDLRRARTLFTIHNMSYQGIYSRHTMDQLGLPAALFHPGALEFFGRVNLLKGALLYSHHLTTVSPTYAREIQTPAFGCGLDGVLRSRAWALTGILNGIDTRQWDPETDPALPANYRHGDTDKKAACKLALQERFGLPADPAAPLLGVISRLANQKGFDILAPALPEILARGAQFILLGTGQPEYHDLFTRLRADYPDRVGVELGFNDALARQIEAGADIFLMPSAFEPCGLNQMYSLRYGAVPVVRRTGGLADSIVDATPENLAAGRATGFIFDGYTPAALLDAVDRALTLYREEPESWSRLVDAGMARDFSWDHSAREYERLMKGLI